MQAHASSLSRILVVEDDAPVCRMLQDVLTAEGYEPICALGDQAAYRTLDEQGASITALVVDINLGRGTTGFDVARHARRLNPRVPVIYITGAPSRSIETHGVQGGVLVTKPFDHELLTSTLREKLAAA